MSGPKPCEPGCECPWGECISKPPSTAETLITARLEHQARGGDRRRDSTGTSRPSWDAYFLDLARTVSTRATCPRRQVGCVLVTDRQVLSTGYNGAVRGAEHCPEPIQYEDEGKPEYPCAELKGNCQRSVHAEVNAVAQAARSGTRLEGCTAYVTVKPCVNCYRVLVNAGVADIVYQDEYGGEYETVPQVRMWRNQEAA